MRTGIVKQAVSDYILAMLGSKVNGREPIDTMHEIEYFFRSSWFDFLSGGAVSGNAAIEACREQGRYAIWRRDHECNKCSHKKCVHSINGGSYIAKRECEKDKNLSEKC